MILTQLEKVGKRKVKVYIDHSLFCFLYINEVYRLGLREDQEITKETFEELNAQLLLRAKRKGLALLKYQDRTVKELTNRLLRLDYPEYIVEQAMEYINSFGYLDDERYARQYMEYRGQGKSRLQAKQDLLKKGISGDLFDRLWEEYNFDEEAALTQMLEKRIRQKGPITEENFQKTYGYLARKGFSSSNILGILKKYKQ